MPYVKNPTTHRMGFFAMIAQLILKDKTFCILQIAHDKSYHKNQVFHYFFMVRDTGLYMDKKGFTNMILMNFDRIKFFELIVHIIKKRLVIR